MPKLKKYVHEEKGFEVEAIQFDAEIWLHERSKAYPMTTCKDFQNGTGIFGFNYGSVLIGQSYLINHCDYIVLINGEYSTMTQQYFQAFYKEKIVT